MVPKEYGSLDICCYEMEDNHEKNSITTYNLLRACSGRLFSYRTINRYTADNNPVHRLTGFSRRFCFRCCSSDLTAAPEETTVALGDKMTLADWTITAKKASVEKKIKNGKYQYFQPKKGNSFIVVSLSVRNEGKQAEDFLPRVGYEDKMTSVTLFYKDGYEYKPTELIAYDKDLTTRKVQPLSTEKGVVAFEVPKEAAKAKKDLKLTFKSKGQTASYSLK